MLLGNFIVKVGESAVERGVRLGRKVGVNRAVHASEGVAASNEADHLALGEAHARKDLLVRLGGALRLGKETLCGSPGCVDTAVAKRHHGAAA